MESKSVTLPTEVKEFIEKYIYLLDQNKLRMFLYMAAKTFKENQVSKLSKIIKILNDIDIDTLAAQEFLFIEAFKEIHEKLINSNIMYNRIRLTQFLLVNMKNNRFGLSIDQCAGIIQDNNLATLEVADDGSDWMLKW